MSEDCKYLILPKRIDWSHPDNMRRNQYVFASVGLAHTYGNAVSVISNYIHGLFPGNLFNTQFTATKVAYKEFDFRRNSKKEFFRKEKPMILIRPRIMLNDAERFLHGTLLTDLITDNHFYGQYDELLPFIEDKDKGVYVKYKMNRLSMEFEVMLVFETQIEQINIVSYLNNKVRQNRPFFLETALESNISNKLIQIISNETQIPIKDVDGSMGRFISYLNSKSYYPITYKMKNSTGNNEFFMYYKTNVDTTFSDFNVGDLNKKGSVSNDAAVTFNVKVEFNVPAMFFSFHGKRHSLITHRDITDLEPDENILPMFTFQNLVPDVMLPEGFNLHANSVFMCQSEEEDTPEIIQLEDLLDPNLKRAIKYCDKHGIDRSTMLYYVVTRDSEILQQDVDFYLNLTENKITINVPEIESTYRFILYANNLFINNLIKEEFESEEGTQHHYYDPNKDLEVKTLIDSERVDTRPDYLNVDIVVNKDGGLVRDKQSPVIDTTRVDKVYCGVVSYDINKGRVIQQILTEMDLVYNNTITYAYDATDIGKQTFAVPEDWTGKIVIMDMTNNVNITKKFDLVYQDFEFVTNRPPEPRYLTNEDEEINYDPNDDPGRPPIDPVDPDPVPPPTDEEVYEKKKYKVYTRTAQRYDSINDGVTIQITFG